jgi:hypothetical protein
MSDRTDPRIVWGLAGLALLIAALLTVSTAGLLRDTAGRCERKLREHRRLRAIVAGLARYHAAREVFEGLPARRATPLAALIEETMPGQAVEDIRRVGTDTRYGWTVRREEVALAHAPLARVMELVRRAESERPPWGLRRCEIRADPQAPGEARVVLLLETVEKED